MVTENGREFNNQKVKTWARLKGICIDFSILYYHKSNGRIERLNRTIRDGLKKTSGSMSKRLENVLLIYNTRVCHRGIGFLLKSTFGRKQKIYLKQARKIFEGI
ncbi:Pol polyprotein [Dictyocoela muelleri]|nr:Pol polyprotein [Dictyocoela muelleri]